MNRTIRLTFVAATLFAAASTPLLADDTLDDPADGAAAEVPARYVFAPVGFDDNDQTVITIDGYLPSGCYRLMRPEVAIDHTARTINITPIARFFDVPCVEALIPYDFEVQLGVLPEGQYKITIGAAGTEAESLSIAEAASAGPDDYLYAPVDAATVSRDEDTGRLYAQITGRFTNTCMTWDQIRVIDNGKSINVLPVMSMSDTAPQGEECRSAEVPYKKRVELPETMAQGRHLLHVRSLNGRGINHLFSVTGR